MAKKDDVVFRRIRGRIVPIKRKTVEKQIKAFEQKRAAQGKALALAGVATAAASGFAAGRIFKAATKIGQKIDFTSKALDLANKTGMANQTGMFAQFSGIALKRAAKQRKKMVTGFKASRALMGFGTIAGAGLVGEGLPRVTSKGKESSISEDVAANAAGLAVAAATTRAFKAGATGRLLRQIGKKRPGDFKFGK